MTTPNGDPYFDLIARCYGIGYQLTPWQHHDHLGHALIRTRGVITDVVTIPSDDAYALVVRLSGAPDPVHPRRLSPILWQHKAPLDIALTWAATNPDSDNLLADWRSRAYPGETQIIYTSSGDSVPVTRAYRNRMDTTHP